MLRAPHPAADPSPGCPQSMLAESCCPVTCLRNSCGPCRCCPPPVRPCEAHLLSWPKKSQTAGWFVQQKLPEHWEVTESLAGTKLQRIIGQATGDPAPVSPPPRVQPGARGYLPHAGGRGFFPPSSVPESCSHNPSCLLSFQGMAPDYYREERSGVFQKPTACVFCFTKSLPRNTGRKYYLYSEEPEAQRGQDLGTAGVSSPTHLSTHSVRRYRWPCPRARAPGLPALSHFAAGQEKPRERWSR